MPIAPKVDQLFRWLDLETPQKRSERLNFGVPEDIVSEGTEYQDFYRTDSETSDEEPDDDAQLASD